MKFTKKTSSVLLEPLWKHVIGFSDYIGRHRAQFFLSAPPADASDRRLWTDTCGWGIATDWPSWAAAMAERTRRWTHAFAPLRELYELLYDTSPAPTNPAALPRLPALWTHPGGRIELTAPLRGIRAHRNAEQLAALAPGTALLAQREPHNPYDPHAIAIHNTRGQILAHLPAEIARLIAPHIDRSNRRPSVTLATRPDPGPAQALHRRWDPLLRRDVVLVTVTF
jgi:hypothetical protein